MVLLEGVVEQPQAVLEVAEELLLLLADRRSGSAGRCRAARDRAAHDLGDDRHELVEERLATAHLVGVEHGPAEQAADDVALLLGPGLDVLVDAERQGPGVVGHPADADAVGLVAVVRARPGCSATAATIGRKMSISKFDRHALQAGRGPLQAHAGVDVLLGQRLELAGADAVELGEDQVPDLDFLDAVAVVEDLRARAADAVGPVRRGAGGPEVVVLAHPGDPVGGDA